MAMSFFRNDRFNVTETKTRRLQKLSQNRYMEVLGSTTVKLDESYLKHSKAEEEQQNYE